MVIDFILSEGDSSYHSNGIIEMISREFILLLQDSKIFYSSSAIIVQ
jgi:hypothetical protein